MHKKEILEIRKQFTPANCAITRICGCYVNHEKEKICQSKQAFLSMPEEEAFKYFDIFKHTLSGTVGKNMINMEFTLDSEMPGGAQEFLMKLRESELKDDMLVEEAFISDLIGYEKPAIEFFDHVFEKIGEYKKEEILIIGDSLTSDMQGGNNAGIVCCWYNPNHLENTKNVRIDYEIDDLWQLEEILKKHA